MTFLSCTQQYNVTLGGHSVFWVLLSALVHYCWVHDRNVIWHVKNFLSYLMHSFSNKLTVAKLVEKWWEIETWLPFHTWCLLYVTDQESFNSCMSHLWGLFKFLPPITMYTIILSICYNHDLCHHCNMAKWIELSWGYFQLILHCIIRKHWACKDASPCKFHSRHYSVTPGDCEAVNIW